MKSRTLSKPYDAVDLSCGGDYRKIKKNKEKERQKRKAQKERERKEREAASSTTSEDTNTETSSETTQEDAPVSNNNSNNNNQIVDQPMEGGEGGGGGGDLMSEYTKEFLDMETTRKWNELEMIGSVAITREDYIAQLEATGNGDIVFSFKNENLHYGTRNDHHFNLSSKKSRSRVREDHPNDIAKSMKLEHLTSNGLKDHMTLIETNIEKFSNEGFISNSKNITAVLMPGQLEKLNSGTGQPFKIFDRVMDNNAMLWLQQNPGRSHKNIKADIKEFHNNKFTIPLDHPIINVFNVLNPDKAITQPSEDKALRKQNLTVVSKRFLSTYEPITANAMKNSISYANITGKEGIVLTFKAPISPEAKSAHDLFVSSGGSKGAPWLGFFHDETLNVLRINFKLNSEYAKCDEDFVL